MLQRYYAYAMYPYGDTALARAKPLGPSVHKSLMERLFSRQAARGSLARYPYPRYKPLRLQADLRYEPTLLSRADSRRGCHAVSATAAPGEIAAERAVLETIRRVYESLWLLAAGNTRPLNIPTRWASFCRMWTGPMPGLLAEGR